MANNASAKKRIRQTEVRAARNRTMKSRVRTYWKQMLALIEEGDAEGAKEAFKQFSSAADLAAKKRVIHKNTASRLKSRMASRLSAM